MPPPKAIGPGGRHSPAVGLAIAEGKLSLDDEVLKFFPDKAPAEPSDNLKQMRVHDLLRMSTGQQTEPPRTADESWSKTFLAQGISAALVGYLWGRATAAVYSLLLLTLRRYYLFVGRKDSPQSAPQL